MKTKEMQNARSLAPKYRLIERDLRQQILSKGLGEGDMLPSEQEIAQKYGVSHLTARHALICLQEGGLVVRHPGRGTFVKASFNLENPDQERKASSLAFVMVDDCVNPGMWIAQCAEEISSAVGEHGLHLMLTTLDSAELMRGRVPKSMTEGHIRAAVIDGFVQEMHLQLLDYYKIPKVVLGVCQVSDRHARVWPDVREAAFQITKVLVGRGRPVWFVRSPDELHYLMEIQKGYQDGMQASSEYLPRTLLRIKDENAFRTMVRRILDSEGPDCYFLTTDEQGLAVIREELLSRKIPPAKMGIVLLGNTHVLPEVVRSATICCHIDPVRMARVAVNMLLEHLGGKPIRSCRMVPQITPTGEGPKPFRLGWKNFYYDIPKDPDRKP